MADVKQVKRTEIIAYLDTTPNAEPTWARIGKGVTGLSYAYNPKMENETYIDEENANTSVDSYNLNLDGEQTCYVGDPVFDFVDKLRYDLATGADAETNILLIDKYSVSSLEEPKFRAQKFKCSVAVNEFGGEGGQKPKIKYTITANGNPENGTATISAGNPTFSPAV